LRLKSVLVFSFAFSEYVLRGAMTVIVALTYPGGAVVASDSRRVETDASGKLFTGSDQFAKTFRRDWDSPRAVNTNHRLVIGGIAGQLFVGHLRLTAAIEALCTAASNLADLEKVVLEKMAEWIVKSNGADIVLVASPTLDSNGQPAICHLRSDPGATVAMPVALAPLGNVCVTGSGGQHALAALRGQQWSNASGAEAAAQQAVLHGIQGSSACGGAVSIQRWP
jgi:hypothetical protein